MGGFMQIGQAITGSWLNAVSQIRAGQQEDDASKADAEQMKEAAGAAQAQAQRKAIEERRRGELVLSRQRAVVAGGGGQMSDPGVIDQTAAIEAQADYNAASALWNGNERARVLTNQATLRRWQGRQAHIGSQVAAISNIFSLTDAYGDRYSRPSTGPRPASAGGGNSPASANDGNYFGGYANFGGGSSTTPQPEQPADTSTQFTTWSWYE